MAWNFPTSMPRDLGPGGTRNTTSQILECGPGAVSRAGAAFANLQTQPFSTSMTAIFAFYYRTGWSSIFAAREIFMSFGEEGKFTPMFEIATENISSNNSLQIKVWDQTAATTRYEVTLGDEDGATWLVADKWYQVGFSFNSTEMTYAINGVATPTVTVNTDAAGSIDVSTGNDRVWMHGQRADSNFNMATVTRDSMFTAVLGPQAFSTTALDLNDATVRARIWDSDGNFKNPGENGSLWFNGTYSADAPEWWFDDGYVRNNKGITTQDWSGSGHTQSMVPAGLKEQYS